MLCREWTWKDTANPSSRTGLKCKAERASFGYQLRQSPFLPFYHLFEVCIENTSGQTKGRMVVLQILHKETPECWQKDPTCPRISTKQSIPAGRQLKRLGKRQLSCHTQPCWISSSAHPLEHFQCPSWLAELGDLLGYAGTGSFSPICTATVCGMGSLDQNLPVYRRRAVV